jgi:aspartyl-tRNA(Asn)/glutamyl-tRNA(Gln) amidotransferase subunit A
METAAALARQVRAGARSAAALTDDALTRIRERDGDLHAFLHVGEEPARRAAREVDAGIAAGTDPGPLAGVPVAVKDNLCTRDMPTTAGSRILSGYRPPYDATVVARLRAAGAVAVGKTNLDEFSMGSSCENSAYGPTRNPWDRERVPGGSSGGSAAAVAAGLVELALGSDTGGSVRQPAAFCGVYGLKPTYGRVSRYGLIAYASSLDQVGAFARDVESLVLLYEAVSGDDARDATTVSPPEAAGNGDGGAAGLRVGIAAGLLSGEGVQTAVADAVTAAAGRLAAAGAALTEIALPEPSVAISAYYLLATAEASSNLARYDGVRYGLRVRGEDLEDMYRRTRGEGLGAEVKRRIMLGTYALSAGYYDAYYLKAQKTRVLIRDRFRDLFREVDCVLLPTAPTTAFRLGEKTTDPLAMYLADIFTVYANLTGLPALSVPVGTDGAGLPVGVQLVAAPFREDILFAAARDLAGAAAPPRLPEGGSPA